MNYAFGESTSLYEIMGDRVVYRNLIPIDRRIPSLDELRLDLDMPGNKLPRKAEPEYGSVVAEMLRRGREVDLPGGTVERVLYIGDTKLNDGTAFHNICAAGGWPGWAFIGRDTPSEPTHVEVEGRLCIANRWSALSSFLSYVSDQGFAIDESTVLVIDMDKTAVGARGRNDKVINAARVEGVQRTVADLLGGGFDAPAFRSAYDELNQSLYYGLTADNQDYLAYICLILGTGLWTLEDLISQVHGGTMNTFVEFISLVQQRRSELAASGLTPIHDEVWLCVQAGDPTPFKAFRYNEYLTTTARLNAQPVADVGEALRTRIAITREVLQVAQTLLLRGVMVFGVSDKPDEASVPNAAQAEQGMQPIHRLETLVVGEAKD